jgi:hypothetical protein
VRVHEWYFEPNVLKPRPEKDPSLGHFAKGDH